MSADLKTYSFTLGPLGANCFLVARDGGCLIIDPGGDPEVVEWFLERQHLEPHAILITHGHFDHFAAAEPLALRYDVPVYVSAADAPQVARPELGPLAGFPVEAVTREMVLLGGVQEIELPIPAQAIPTPGHSVGSYTFAVDGELYVGDLLFYGSIGRTDLGGGDYEQLLQSVAELARRFPPDTTVHCGHGPDTVLGRELKINPFLAPLRNDPEWRV